MSVPKTIGERLKTITDACNCSLTTLSKAIGASPATLSQVSRKGTGTIRTLFLLKELTRVNLNWLVAGEGLPELVIGPAAAAKIIAARVQPNAPPKRKSPTRAHKPSPKIGQRRRAT